MFYLDSKKKREKSQISEIFYFLNLNGRSNKISALLNHDIVAWLIYKIDLILRKRRNKKIFDFYEKISLFEINFKKVNENV